jgi:recombination protein RecT
VCSKLGLEPDGAHGCWLVPYGNTCTVVPDYRGLMELARRSGDIASWDSSVVREHDFFECQRGTDRYLRHRPCLTGDPGDVVAAYSFVRFKNGGDSFIVMSKAELDKVKKSSKTSGRGPWSDWTEEMMVKTVLKRHTKTLPYSTEDLRVAVAMDTAVDQAEPGALTDAALSLDLNVPGEEKALETTAEEKPKLSLEERKKAAVGAQASLPGVEEQERGDAFEDH